MTLFVVRYASFTLPTCSWSEISVVKFSPEPIRWIDSDIWLTWSICGYPKCITCCSMVFRSSCRPIVSHQASDSIKRVDNSSLNCISSFEVIQSISLWSWFATRSVSATLQVVASVSATDGRTSNSTSLSAVMFATPYTSSSAAVFIWASCFANMLLGRVTWVLTSSTWCRSWCLNNVLKSLHLTGVTWWILRYNYSFALGRSPSDRLVATCRALFMGTCSCLHFVGVIVSDPYTWTNMAARILRIFYSHNWSDTHANFSSTLAFAEFDIFCCRISPFFL